jgi:carbon monoxide dehydrogenase subunit G
MIHDRPISSPTMRLENSFEVPASPERAWALLLDVPRVVPCMPGAELTETVDESHWKATMDVKLGPMSMTFAADVDRREVDEDAKRVVLGVRARELKGRGGATATIESSLTDAGGITSVGVVTDLQLSGAAAQFGGSVVKTVAGQLTARFADCLQKQLRDEATPDPAANGRRTGVPPVSAPPPTAAKPVGGLRLLLDALLARLRRS